MLHHRKKEIALKKFKSILLLYTLRVENIYTRILNFNRVLPPYQIKIEMEKLFHQYN